MPPALTRERTASVLNLLALGLTVALASGPSDSSLTAVPAVAPAPAAAPRTSSPARQWVVDTVRPMGTRPPLTILLAGSVAGAVCTTFEDPVAMSEALQQPPFDWLSDIGNTYGEPPVIAGTTVLLYAAGRWSGHAELRDAGFDSMRALVLATTAVGLLKLTVPRERPDGDDYSFPSGHAAATMSVAPVITHHLGLRAGIPAYALAGLACMGRIEANRHYLSDVVWGATLGLACGVAQCQPRGTGPARLGALVEGDRLGCVLRF